MQVTPHENYGDVTFSYVAFFMVEHMAVMGFQCVGTRQSLRRHSGVDGLHVVLRCSTEGFARSPGCLPPVFSLLDVCHVCSRLNCDPHLSSELGVQLCLINERL